MTRNRRRLAVLGGVLLVLAGAGDALAAYLSSGSFEMPLQASLASAAG